MRDETDPRQDRLQSGVVCLTHGILFVCPGRLRISPTLPLTVLCCAPELDLLDQDEKFWLG